MEKSSSRVSGSLGNIAKLAESTPRVLDASVNSVKGLVEACKRLQKQAAKTAKKPAKRAAAKRAPAKKA